MDQEGFWEAFLRYLKQRPGRVAGTVIGFLLGACLVWLGLWRTLVLGLFTVIGYSMGKWTDDEGKGLREFLEEKLPGRPDFH